MNLPWLGYIDEKNENSNYFRFGYTTFTLGDTR